MNREQAIKWCKMNGYGKNWYRSTKWPTPPNWQCVVYRVPYSDIEYILINPYTNERITKEDMNDG